MNCATATQSAVLAKLAQTTSSPCITYFLKNGETLASLSNQNNTLLIALLYSNPTVSVTATGQSLCIPLNSYASCIFNAFPTTITTVYTTTTTTATTIASAPSTFLYQLKSFRNKISNFFGYFKLTLY